jgi:hypothetical protein
VIFLLDQDPRSRLVLSGVDRMVAAFERALPERIQQGRIMARLPHPGSRAAREGEIRARVLEEVLEALVANERQEEERRVHRVVGDALAGGLAALGPEDVVLAVNENRIHRLYVEDGFDAPGWRCLVCDALGIDGAVECGFCGGVVTTVNLGEELARRVIEAGGQVQVLEPQPRLHHYHGLAARLRHRGTPRAAIGVAVEVPPVP